MTDKNKTRKNKVVLLKSFIVIVPYIIKSAPWLFLCGCAVFVAQALIGSFQIYVLEDVFNGAAELAAGKIGKTALITSILIYVGSFILSQCLSPIANYSDTRFNQISSNRQRMDMYEKMSKLEPILFENTEVLDDIEKANNGIDSARRLVSTVKTILLSHVPYLAVVSVYMIKREPLLMAAMVLIFLPTLLEQYVIKKVYRNKEDHAAPMRRKKDYYAECITSPTYYKETRMLGAYGYFIKGHRTLAKKLLDLDVKTAAKQDILYLLA